MNKNLLFAITSAILFNTAGCLAADLGSSTTNQMIERVSKFGANAARKLTNGNSLSVRGSWSDNPEVGEVKSLASAKRCSVIYEVIDQLEKNDAIVFDKQKTDQFQLAASVLTRQRALTYLEELVQSPVSDNEIILKDYLAGEIADLKLVTTGRIPYGLYLQARKARDDKRGILLMTDKGFVEELLNLGIKKDPLPQRLANITTMASFMGVCFNRLETLCGKL